MSWARLRNLAGRVLCQPAANSTRPTPTPAAVDLAAEKRRLEAVCRARGCSKSVATAIAGDFFRAR
jgi:hypothetical protein